MTKKLHIKTWGCQMNVYDSSRMADVLAPLGYTPTDDMFDAELVIFNTCHIREKASEKLFSELGRLRDAQKEKAPDAPRTLIGVAGCVAQAEGTEIQRRAPYVDMIFGPQTYHQLPEMIARLTRSAGRVLNTEFPSEDKFDLLPDTKNPSGVGAFLSIQEGCDKFCSYCVVPYTRGSEYSRSKESVVHEVTNLVAQGAREITLLGQNVNAYRTEEGGFTDLLYALAKVDGLKRLRYMTSHPNDMEEALVQAHADLPQLMPFLHLPVQSGSDKILAAMNRKHKADDYRRLIEKFRAARPDMAFSSDFIVGFPGETEKDFEATLALVRDVNFAQAYSFKFSSRPGTPAATLSPQIKETIKDERIVRLQELLRAQQDAFNNNVIGKTLPVLLETKGHKEGQLRGKTPYAQTVHVLADEHLLGTEVSVCITEAKTNSLMGELG